MKVRALVDNESNNHRGTAARVEKTDCPDPSNTSGQRAAFPGLLLQSVEPVLIKGQHLHNARFVGRTGCRAVVEQQNAVNVLLLTPLLNNHQQVADGFGNGANATGNG